MLGDSQKVTAGQT